MGRSFVTTGRMVMMRSIGYKWDERKEEKKSPALHHVPSCSKLRRFGGVVVGVYRSWRWNCRGRATNARRSSPRFHCGPKSNLPGARGPTVGSPTNPRRGPWAYQQQLHQCRGMYRLPCPGPGACRRCLPLGEPSVPSQTTAWATHGVSAHWRAEDRGHQSQQKPNKGCSGQFMGSPSGGRGPSRERDRNSTGQNGSKRRGGGGGQERGRAGGRGGCVGGGVLDSENNGRSVGNSACKEIGRMSWARPTEGSEECAWELYLASNRRSRAPSTHTVGRSSCKISKSMKVRW